MAERDLVVRFIGDDRDLQQAFRNTERGAARFEARTTRLGTAGAGLGRAFAGYTAAIVSAETIRRALVASITSASDLNEQISRTEVILGDAADEAIAWSRDSATAFGISQRAALAANATFAGLFQTVGFGQQEAGRLSQRLVELAADLASLQNTSPEEALIALRSGLVGESEPLRRFNIFLSEARVQQDAMAESGKRTAKELTNQEKTLARLNIILRDAAPAAGNFADTSGELANQGRILRANFDNLAGQIGSVLVPVLEDAAETANMLFAALEKMRGVDFSPGFDFPDPPGWLKSLALVPFSPAAAAFGVGRNILEGDDSDRSGGIPGDISRRTDQAKRIADEAEAEARAINQAALEANRAQRRAQRAYDALVKGLGLKLDKAQLTATLDDDLAALRELERAIQRQIRREGRTFELVQALTDVRIDIASTVAQQADEAAQRAQDAWSNTLDALQLDLEVAQSTQSLVDDLAALKKIEDAIVARIAAEGRTTELARQLFQNRQEQAQTLQRMAERTRDRRRGRQFEALGLTEEGDERVPSARALRRRVDTLEDQVKGTILDTPQTARKLDRIRDVLAGKFGQVGREVRQRIQAMIQDIAGALDQDIDVAGPLTAASGLNTRKVLEGLGLTPEQINELRGRLSSINTQGMQVGTQPPRATSTTGFGGIQGRILVESHTTINLDGQKVASVVTRNQQRTRRRNPKQKRGPNRGL